MNPQAIGGSDQIQASTPSEVAELRGQMEAMQTQMAEMAQMRSQMAEMMAMMRAMQPQVMPAPAPPPVVEGPLTDPVAVTVSPVPVQHNVPTAPAPVTVGATIVTPATHFPTPTPHDTQGANQRVPPEQIGGGFTHDLPGTEPDVNVTLPAKSKEGEEKSPEWKAALDKLSEKFKAMEGVNQYDTWDVDELCLFPKVEVPPKFKVPDFVKYNGTTNPEYHLRSYCTRMGNWSRDENFLLAYFHESLTGPAYNWYMRLDQSSIKSWRDMVLAFKKHYRHNIQNAPTRDAVQALRKKPNETFREYAERWRQMASEVQPPMSEFEMSTYFVRTLSEPFYGFMIALPSEDFSQIIRIGELLDNEAKEGRLSSAPQSSYKRGTTGASNTPPKKKEGEVNLVQGSSSRPQTNFTVEGQQANGRFQKIKAPRDDRPMPNFGVSNAELFKILRDKGLVGPMIAQQLVEPYPAWYKPELSCDYHMGVKGHSIETCVGFRRHVLGLLDNKLIAIEQGGSNITGNPLPTHAAYN